MNAKNKFSAAMKGSAAKEAQNPSAEPNTAVTEPLPNKSAGRDEQRQVWKTPRTRKGRKGIMTYVESDAHKALAMLAIEQDKTQQELMREALNGLFRQYGKTPIA